jgi:hypothetical protein
MDHPLSTQEQKQMDDLTAAIASDLAKGVPPRTVSKEMVQNGWEQADADRFIEQVQSAMYNQRQSPDGQAIVREARRARNQRNMLVGGLWCAGGAIVTFLTYALASGGGTYVVAWGAIAFGALQFLSGLYGSVRDT